MGKIPIRFFVYEGNTEKGGCCMTKAELYKKACMLPMLPGVYIIRDKKQEIIYIGKAKRLRVRVSQYFREGVPHDA